MELWKLFAVAAIAAFRFGWSWMLLAIVAPRLFPPPGNETFDKRRYLAVAIMWLPVLAIFLFALLSVWQLGPGAAPAWLSF